MHIFTIGSSKKKNLTLLKIYITKSATKEIYFGQIPMDKSTACTSSTFSEKEKWLPDNPNGKEIITSQSGKATYQEEYVLDDVGFGFVKKCIEVIESHGLDDEGLYRLVGVNSKVNKLTQLALDRRKIEKVNLNDANEWEIKTITSALKNYFRNLSEPLLTFKLHSAFIAAAKQENKLQKITDIHALVYRLPKSNFRILELLIRHLCRVAKHSNKNLMTISNLGVCFGPTLLRQHEQTASAILDIKFGNIVVEILIENCDKIFGTIPGEKKCERTFTSHSNNCHSAILQEESTHDIGRSEKEFVDYEESNQFTNSITNNSSASHQAIVRTSKLGTLTAEVSSSNAILQKSYTGHIPPANLFHPNHVDVHLPKNYQKEAYDSQYSSLLPHGYSTIVKKKTSAVYNPTFHDNMHSNSGNTDSINSYLYPSNQSISHHSPSSTPKTSPRTKHFTNISYDSSSVSEIIRSSDIRNDGCGKISEDFLDFKYSHTSGYRNSFDGTTMTRATQYQLSPSPISLSTGRRVRTLYSCIGENESELSFEPNQVIYNVRPSKEPGWLEGYLNGHVGLVPENYVEYLP